MREHSSDPTTAELLARLALLEAQMAELKAQTSDADGHTSVSQAAAPAREPTASRRDLLRYGAVALGAAAAGLAAPRPAEAANGDPLVIGSITNSATALTRLNSTFTGLESMAQGPVGLAGASSATDGTGVVGNAFGLGVNRGVFGHSFSFNGSGVHGLNDDGGTGVLGEIRSFSTANGIAVAGFNSSSFVGSGPGGGGFGVYGLSSKGHGLVGATLTAGGAALAGSTNGVAGAYAGVFYGPVVAVGNLVVTGAKSAAVPHVDGTHRLVYCVESPESWFEDFGKGQLQCGQADVTIDPDFAAIVNLDDYHVFVTGYDDFELRVTDQTAAGFRVLAKAANSAGRFSWRVVARRKDIDGDRLATVTIPPAPTLPDIPVTPEPPAFEGLGRRG
jgi:hypothetical protein